MAPPYKRTSLILIHTQTLFSFSMSSSLCYHSRKFIQIKCFYFLSRTSSLLISFFVSLFGRFFSIGFYSFSIRFVIPFSTRFVIQFRSPSYCQPLEFAPFSILNLSLQFLRLYGRFVMTGEDCHSPATVLKTQFACLKLVLTMSKPSDKCVRIAENFFRILITCNSKPVFIIFFCFPIARYTKANNEAAGKFISC